MKYSTHEMSIARPYCQLWFTKKLSKDKFWGLLNPVVTNSERWKKARTVR